MVLLARDGDSCSQEQMDISTVWLELRLLATMAYPCRLVISCKEEMDCFSNVEVFIVIVPNSEIDKFYK